jgi:hypothetical protein
VLWLFDVCCPNFDLFGLCGGQLSCAPRAPLSATLIFEAGVPSAFCAGPVDVLNPTFKEILDGRDIPHGPQFSGNLVVLQGAVTN